MPDPQTLIMLLAIAVVGVVAMVGLGGAKQQQRRRTICPECGADALREVLRQQVAPPDPLLNKTGLVTWWQCAECNASYRREDNRRRQVEAGAIPFDD